MDTASAPVSTATSTPAGQGNTPAPTTTDTKGASPGSPKPAAQSADDHYEIKVNDKTFKLTREELIKKAQLGYSAHERFEQSAQQKKQVDAILSTFRTNPVEALLNPALGLTKDQVRQAMEDWYTREYIEPEKLTPEQLRLRDAESKLRTYEEQEKQKQKEQQETQMAELTQRQREHVQNQITETLDKSGLPKTKFIVSRMAYWMRHNLSNGWDAPMEVIIDQVKRERQDMLSDLTTSTEMDTLVNYLGKDFVNKIRKWDLSQLRARKSGGVNPEDAIRPKQNEKPEEGGTRYYRDVNKNLRRLMQGK